MLLKSLQILEKVSKLCKSNQDTHNPGKWLILKVLLKNWVAEGVASDPHDTNQEGATLTCRKRTLKNKANLTELSQDAILF